MVALHNALEDNDEKGVERLVALYRSSNRPSINEIPRYDRQMIQQQHKGKGSMRRLSIVGVAPRSSATCVNV